MDRQGHEYENRNARFLRLAFNRCAALVIGRRDDENSAARDDRAPYGS
jgi:hypothetical protein